jgi:molybdopterin-guanine dinucleotide biosynthesis protein A
MRHGILLLSGGSGRRMGAPKHGLEHPAGSSWGAHLIRTFDAVFPEGTRLVLGDPLPDYPNLDRLDDPRLGPAIALRTWAQARLAGAVPGADRWWIVACDQVRWTPERLRAWTATCQQEDPGGGRWVIAAQGKRLQPLGGWFPQALCPQLAACEATALTRMVEALPHLILPEAGEEWRDVDTPEERQDFEAESRTES